jgi:RimJ/RimL family protein N-acetyltransferase
MQTVHWPLFELRIETPRVTLRYPDDDDVVALAELAAAGVHDPSWMPFSIPWTDVEPPLLQRSSLQYIWSTRAQWSSERWHMPMAVVVDDDIVGVQGIEAEQFAVLRCAKTGSWLGRRYQGKGIGTEMRAAILHLAFAGLGAEYASSSAFADNDASIGVSRRLGYEEVARRRVVRRDAPAWMVELRMSRARWEEQRRDDIAIINLEPCLELFGAT